MSDVRAAAAVNTIGTVIQTKEGIVASVAEQGVGAAAAIEQIIACAAMEAIAAGIAKDAVSAAVAVDVIVALTAGQRVVPGPSVKGVLAMACQARSAAVAGEDGQPRA